MTTEQRTAETLLPRLRRFWYLLTVGMWRGECAINGYDCHDRIKLIAAAKPFKAGDYVSFKIFWER